MESLYCRFDFVKYPMAPQWRASEGMAVFKSGIMNLRDTCLYRNIHKMIPIQTAEPCHKRSCSADFLDSDVVTPIINGRNLLATQQQWHISQRNGEDIKEVRISQSTDPMCRQYLTTFRTWDPWLHCLAELQGERTRSADLESPNRHAAHRFGSLQCDTANNVPQTGPDTCID